MGTILHGWSWDTEGGGDTPPGPPPSDDCEGCHTACCSGEDVLCVWTDDVDLDKCDPCVAGQEACEVTNPTDCDPPFECAVSGNCCDQDAGDCAWSQCGLVGTQAMIKIDSGGVADPDGDACADGDVNCRWLYSGYPMAPDADKHLECVAETGKWRFSVGHLYVVGEYGPAYLNAATVLECASTHPRGEFDVAGQNVVGFSDCRLYTGHAVLS